MKGGDGKSEMGNGPIDPSLRPFPISHFQFPPFQRLFRLMLPIDLQGKRALVAGVADDAGFGFAIAKALAEAGASVSVGTWPPALNIFMNLLERGKIEDRKSTRLNSSHSQISYAVFCLKKKKKNRKQRREQAL